MSRASATLIEESVCHSGTEENDDSFSLTESYVACYKGKVHATLVPTLGAEGGVGEPGLLNDPVKCDCRYPRKTGDLFVGRHLAETLDRWIARHSRTKPHRKNHRARS